MAPRCRHSVHGPPIQTGTRLPAWQESQCSDPVIPSNQTSFQKHAASLRCNNTPLLGLVAYAPRATSIYKAFSFIHCQWSFLWIYRLRLGLCMSVSFAVCHALTPCSLCHDLPPHTLFFFDGKSALETQFTFSHFKPAVSANTQNCRDGGWSLDWKKRWNIVVRNLGAVECMVCAAYVSKE